jgi:hypothetical protein
MGWSRIKKIGREGRGRARGMGKKTKFGKVEKIKKKGGRGWEERINWKEAGERERKNGGGGRNLKREG